jgi:hypothetical protein
LAALRAKQTALENQVAAERARALQAEADKRIAEAKVSQLQEKDTFMAATVSSWKAASEVDRDKLFEQLKLQSAQVAQLVATNDARAVTHL